MHVQKWHNIVEIRKFYSKNRAAISKTYLKHLQTPDYLKDARISYLPVNSLNYMPSTLHCKHKRYINLKDGYTFIVRLPLEQKLVHWSKSNLLHWKGSALSVTRS